MTERHLKNLAALASLKSDCPNHELLRQYTGWGGLRDEVYTPAIYKELKKVLTKEEIGSIKKTLHSAYYTPVEIVKFMYLWLQDYGFKGGTILEPAVGNGVFIEHMPKVMKHNSDITAIEIDQPTCDIVKTLYPEVKLYTCGFEKFNEQKQFDLIIGNPPYGSDIVFDTQHQDISNYCIHHYFVAKSMRLLKNDGILAMVLPSYFLDNVSQHVRGIIKKEGGDLITAYRLTDDLFLNAKVTIDIVFLKKGCTSNFWVNTKKIKIGNFFMPLNEYFHKNMENILGSLEVTAMYERHGLTCRSNGKHPFELLFSKIKKNSGILRLSDYILQIDTSIIQLQQLKKTLLNNEYYGAITQ